MTETKLRKFVAKKLSDAKLKHPTIAADVVAYTSGSNKTFSTSYNTYVSSVETIERVIRLIANITSLCKYKIYKEDTKGVLKPLNVKNVNLEFINEVDSYVDFNRKLAVSVFSQGAGIIVAETNKGMTNFYVLDAAAIEIESDGRNLIDRFIYVAKDGSRLEYKAKDVIYVNNSVDPSNLLYSLSSLKALNDVVQIQAGIVARVKEYAQGAAKESAIVSAEAPMSADTQGKLKDAFDKFMGNTSSATLFVNTKLDVKQLSNAMDGTDMLNFFTAVNQLMISQFNIPAHLLGDLSKQGANKSDEVLYALKIWFTTNLRPILTNIELQFTRYFRDVLGIKNARIKFDVSDIDILDDFIERKTDRSIKLSKAGIISINEARAMVELDAINAESADLHFMPAYLLGSAPVSIENFDTEVERLLQGVASTSTDTLPAGNSGDEDNTNVQTGQRGGNDANAV